MSLEPMKQIVLMIAGVAMWVGCLTTTIEITSAPVEQAIRQEIQKPEGELTRADLEKVTKLYLVFFQSNHCRTQRSGKAYSAHRVSLV
tara:strand:+ start:99 stop:362 length:264 start_codon:yes stop_codon:yes gene_type:complete